MNKENLTITIAPGIKKKLILDSVRLGFNSKSLYLSELIKKGLPHSESLDIRLQLIEQKIDMLPGNSLSMFKNLSHEIDSALRDVNKRTYITFRIVAYILARTFLIEDATISEGEINEANKFIENEMIAFKKMSADK
jgi:hypothetical protein